MPALLVFALGLLAGRFASGLPEGATGLLDIAIAALLAVSVTLMWRRWARRAMESRRVEQQRRAGAKR
jgi:membrane protein implicated in regulation of membrane protease activity